MDEFNNRKFSNIDERNTIDVPNKQSKYITSRKRKELINKESEGNVKLDSNDGKKEKRRCC